MPHIAKVSRRRASYQKKREKKKKNAMLAEGKKKNLSAPNIHGTVQINRSALWQVAHFARSEIVFNACIPKTYALHSAPIPYFNERMNDDKGRFSEDRFARNIL